MPFRIIDQEDKAWSSSHALNHADYWNWVLTTGGASYEYTVNVKMKIEELTTGATKNVEFDFPLYYMDVADGCTPLE
jgi:hypothetical protein